MKGKERIKDEKFLRLKKKNMMLKKKQKEKRSVFSVVVERERTGEVARLFFSPLMELLLNIHRHSQS